MKQMKIQLKGWSKNLLLVLLGVVLGYLLLLGPLFWLSMRLPENNHQAFQAEFCRERLQKTVYPALMNYLKTHNRQFPKGWKNQEAFQKDLAAQLTSSLELQCPFQAMTASRAYRFNFGIAGERLEDLRNPEKLSNYRPIKPGINFC